jgi:hypothetical protein
MNGAAANVEAALAMSDVWRSATVFAIKKIETRRRREIVANIVEALSGR